MRFGTEASLRDVEQALREARSPDVRRLLRGMRDSLRARLDGGGDDGEVQLEPASRSTEAELAALFTAGYAGYFMPVEIDEARFSSMAAFWDYDLDASRVARVDSEPVGIAMLARRGPDAWVGGVGVIPARRGAGVGKALMQALAAEARDRGVERLWLEVLVQNDPAIALYERLGYARVRELEVWSLEGLVFQEHKVPSTPASAARERIHAARSTREPWQRTDASLANLDGVEGLATEDAAALYRVSAGRVSLLQGVAADEKAARELLLGLPVEAESLTYLNGEAGDPFCRALDSLGGTLAARQHEMLLEL